MLGLKTTFIVLLTLLGIFSDSFKDEQLQYTRVQQAYAEKWGLATARLRLKGVNPYDLQLFIRAFKFEEDVEVWAKNTSEDTFQKIHTFKFCENVGELGPKRREGDMQIPEGLYHISQFNPTSDYFLSLKINYPNISDKILGDPVRPGGQIFIHGGCATIGCIPITNEGIKELYLWSVLAKNNGQEQIPVHIYPARFTPENWELLKAQYSIEKLAFWQQLRKAYDYFEESKSLPPFFVREDGSYVLPSYR
jgi:murein L,D-transpeptidase YafK